ncbi:MAG TPA: MOSC N-terminal beta barrel domain-containing protein [Anaeromyxobacteraceae bacterium]|nr:MOSC N-terminal beta barrel domain-containing protein [Anaeromyxobacteraceae bacterium]
MRIAELWRYPVKSMAGEPLEAAELGPHGVAGDRILAVFDRAGGIVTSRSRPRLLGHRATLGPDGEPLVDGRPWRSPGVARDVVDAAGPGAHLGPIDPGDRFDVLPLLVATDGAISSLGLDRRRFRPNLLVGDVPGLAERGWEGRLLRAGPCVVAMHRLRARCVMITFDPDTLVQDMNVLRGVVRELDGTLGLDSSVAAGGTLRVGDPVEVAPRRPGGMAPPGGRG